MFIATHTTASRQVERRGAECGRYQPVQLPGQETLPAIATDGTEAGIKLTNTSASHQVKGKDSNFGRDHHVKLPGQERELGVSAMRRSGLPLASPSGVLLSVLRKNTSNPWES